MTSRKYTLPTGATFHCATVDAVPVVEIFDALREHMVIRIRGLFAPAAIRAAKSRMIARFDCANDRKHDPLDTEAVRTNLQKIVVGGITRTNELRQLARFVRIFYNPIFAEDLYGMREHFVRLARLRNRLYGFHEDFAVHGTEEGYWTASRVHQYPRGGGFMVPHKDAYSVAAIANTGARYAQLLLLMSRLGEDYDDGGAFVVVGGERRYYEDDCEVGDAIVYDGRAVHGVGDVDPMKPIDLTTLSGRMVAFASLYRHLTDGGPEYERLARTATRGLDDAAD